MEITILKCPNCNKKFYTKYYTGGYIDHMNMVNNFDITVNRGKEDIVEEICYKGNIYRGIEDIKEREECFIKYLTDKGMEQDFINDVIGEVNSIREHIKELTNIERTIQNKLNKLSSVDREYIIEHLYT